MDDNEIARRIIATGWAKVDDVDTTNRLIATGWTPRASLSMKFI